MLISFEVSLAMVNAVFESTGISSAILICDFSQPIKFVVFEVALVHCLIFAYKVSLAYLASCLD